MQQKHLTTNCKILQAKYVNAFYASVCLGNTFLSNLAERKNIGTRMLPKNLLNDILIRTNSYHPQ